MTAPKAATIGQTYTTAAINPRTSSFRRDTLTVAASCGGKAGAWHCIEHDSTFRHNMNKDAHLDYPPDREHTLVWICFEHGPEVP